MKPLVKKKVAVSSSVLPGCKFARFFFKRISLFICMNIIAAIAVAFFAVIFKGFF
jgi:hypothetical protein